MQIVAVNGPKFLASLKQAYDSREEIITNARAKEVEHRIMPLLWLEYVIR